MECQCRKAYVSVNVDVDEEGTVHPRFIRWKNGLIFRSIRFFTNAVPALRKLAAVVFATPS